MLQLAWRQGEPYIPNPLEQLYSDHHGMVFRTAYRITGNAADAEDAMQTVFLRVLGRGGRGGAHATDAAAEAAVPIEHPERYLRRAAIHAALDLIRERQAQREKAGAGPPGQATSDPELRQALRDALGSIEARQAEMFVLRFFEGYDNGEIAVMMGVSKLVVAVTLFRTRQRLQKEWNAGGAQ